MTTDRELMQKQNTDRELWREREGDFYADSIHVTKDGRIGMNVGGTVFVMPIKAWHDAAAMRDRLAQPEQEPVGYAGVTIWIGEHQVTRMLTKTETMFERVPGMVITETAQRCLDLLAESMEKNCVAS